VKGEVKGQVEGGKGSVPASQHRGLVPWVVGVLRGHHGLLMGDAVVT
jgi:hypothetical protein